MKKFEVLEASARENTITLYAGDYFENGGTISLGDEMYFLDGKISKLTIPSSIAKILDEFYTKKFFDLEEKSHWLQEKGVSDWLTEKDSKKRYALFNMYLSEKALGVSFLAVE